MLSAISFLGRPPGPEMENCTDRESYSLAAGLALGMVTLGVSLSFSLYSIFCCNFQVFVFLTLYDSCTVVPLWYDFHTAREPKSKG